MFMWIVSPGFKSSASFEPRPEKRDTNAICVWLPVKLMHVNTRYMIREKQKVAYLRKKEKIQL